MASLPPRRTAGLAARAEQFCERYCRHAGEECVFRWEPEACPLWQFVHADLLTSPSQEPSAEAGPADIGYDPDEGYEWPSAGP